MTKSVTYQIYSQDPENYGTVSINPVIPWNTFKVEYKVINVNTFSNFLITTSDDYIRTASADGKVHSEYKFKDKSNYDLDELPTLISELTGLTVKINDAGVLEFSAGPSSDVITECSHRVKLLLGLYNMSFPITLPAVASSTPMLNYGNLLYLKSIQGASVGMILDQGQASTPCIYRINSFLKSGLPLISDKKGDKIIVNAEAAKTISMQLVDFMYEPVILKSPMFVTLKIKLGTGASSSKSIAQNSYSCF